MKLNERKKSSGLCFCSSICNLLDPCGQSSRFDRFARTWSKEDRNWGKKRKYLNKRRKRIIALYFMSIQSELDISVGHLNIWWHWYLPSSPFLFLFDIPVSYSSQPACLVTISSCCYMLKVYEKWLAGEWWPIYVSFW